MANRRSTGDTPAASSGRRCRRASSFPIGSSTRPSRPTSPWPTCAATAMTCCSTWPCLAGPSATARFTSSGFSTRTAGRAACRSSGSATRRRSSRSACRTPTARCRSCCPPAMPRSCRFIFSPGVGRPSWPRAGFSRAITWLPNTILASSTPRAKKIPATSAVT